MVNRTNQSLGMYSSCQPSIQNTPASIITAPPQISTSSKKPASRSTLSSIFNLTGSNFIDPGTRSHENRETRELTLIQVFSARNLLYQPGTMLRREIAKAAGELQDIVAKLSDSELNLLMKRLCGKGGLLADQPPKALKSILTRLAKDNKTEAGNASAVDRAAFISILGDIGALYADAKKFNNMVSSSGLQKNILRDKLSEIISQKGLSSISSEVVDKVAKMAGGAGVVGPRKYAEVKRKDPLPRTGVHDLGKEADDRLGVPQAMRIPAVSWSLAHIHAERVANTSEPLVGHMSGSPGEILMVWDMLCGHRADNLYTGVRDQHQSEVKKNKGKWNPMDHLGAEEKEARLARLSGACAMLVSLGYHSAIEVTEGALKYTGQDIRSEIQAKQDAAHLLGGGAATDIISELFRCQTHQQASQRK